MANTAAAIIEALARVSLTDAAAFVRRVITLCGAASQEARCAIRALVAAVDTVTTVNNNSARTTTRVYTIRYAPKQSKTTFFALEYAIVDWTTEIIDHDDGRVQCIAVPVYAQRAPRAPVEAFHPEYETIETTQVLNVAKLLAHKHVCSVTCEEVTTKAAVLTTATDDEATASESEDEDDITEGAIDDVAHQYDEEEKQEDERLRENNEDDQEEEEEVDGDQVGGKGTDAVARDWPAIALDAMAADVAFDWRIGVYQRPFGVQSAVGSVLLQRRLLGV